MPNFSELLFLGHSEENKICYFNLSLAFSLFTWVSIAKIFKWVAGIGLPSRKREARKMPVHWHSAHSPLYSHLQNLPPRRSIKEALLYFSQNTHTLTYDLMIYLFLFVLLHT